MNGDTVQLKPTKTPADELALTNRVYVSPATFDRLTAISQTPLESEDVYVFVEIQGFVFMCSPYQGSLLRRGLEDDVVGLNGLQRKLARIVLDPTPIPVTVFRPTARNALIGLELSVELYSSKREGPPLTLMSDELSELFKELYKNQVFMEGQVIVMKAQRTNLKVHIRRLVYPDNIVPGSKDTRFGQYFVHTDLRWDTVESGGVLLNHTGGSRKNTLFQGEFNFEKLGIGGLDSEFAQIFRRAFSSRVFPTHIVQQMGITHVRGMLLYGPPGCGKTLIARQIGQILNAREPKIVNGPEILDKYVGSAEEKIRELFLDAEEEQMSSGDDSMLHVIIFDEIDAICKQRGTVRDGTAVHDSIVNQLLSKIDGVESLNNILIIGMTNRKDMIDEALMRPGRLELQVEIGLPDEAGRLQILRIHTATMAKHGRLSQEVQERLPELAKRTQNYSGAELAGIIRDAASYAFHRNVNLQGEEVKISEDDIMVEMQDFERALEEVLPAFGAKSTELEQIFRNGIIHYGEAFTEVDATLDRVIHQLETSDKTPLLTVLLSGSHGCGKSSIAAAKAVSSGFPFIRLISADDLIGMPDPSKCAQIMKVFQDSYRSDKSIIIIDDLERVIDYVEMGLRFSNMVLQTLLVLLRKPPPPGRKLLVLATTSLAPQLSALEMTESFNLHLRVNKLATHDEIREIVNVLSPESENMDSLVNEIADQIPLTGMPIKQVIFLLEMMSSGNKIDMSSVVA